MPDGFRSLEDIFKNEPELRRINRTLTELGVVQALPEIFPELAALITAVKTEKGTLFLRVENPVLRSEIKLHEEIFIAKVNAHFGEQRVTALRFV